MSNVKMVLANKSNKESLIEWEQFIAAIRDSTPIDVNETESQKTERMKRLEKPGNHEEWFKYYFPKFCFAEPADFHKKSTNRFLTKFRIRQSRQWARGLSKSTRRMMEVLYRMLVKKRRTNALLLSRTYDNAERLLNTYMGQLEGNQRIINDYGMQEKAGSWRQGDFTTRKNNSFRAVGRGQSPRGAKNDELRITDIIFDDIDDRDSCRNEELTDQDWEWLERDVLPTVDVSADYSIVCDNNLISENSLSARFAETANDISVVDLEDEDGKSSWPEKNSDTDIADIKATLSYESYESEYKNNPMSKGKTFPDIKYGKCPALKHLRVVVSYADPATSNNDKPSTKSRANNSCKAVALVGYHNFIYYVYKVWVNNTSNSNFIDWIYAAKDYVGLQAIIKMYIENNSLQDPFYQQVLKPLIKERAKQLKRPMISLLPDEDKKGEKWVRIEATLEPLNRNGQLVFNIDEKEDPHMKRMEAQMKGAKANSKRLDGPDALQGAVQKLKATIALLNAGRQIEKVDIDESDKKY